MLFLLLSVDLDMFIWLIHIVNIFPIHCFILLCIQQSPFSFLVFGDMVKSLAVWNCIPWIKFTPQTDLKEGIKPALGSQLGVKWNFNEA